MIEDDKILCVGIALAQVFFDTYVVVEVTNRRAKDSWHSSKIILADEKNAGII